MAKKPVVEPVVEEREAVELDVTNAHVEESGAYELPLGLENSGWKATIRCIGLEEFNAALSDQGKLEALARRDLHQGTLELSTRNGDTLHLTKVQAEALVSFITGIYAQLDDSETVEGDVE